MNLENRKLVLIGTGFVGMSMAYTFLNTGGIDEIVLVDMNTDKTIGEAMDLSHVFLMPAAALKLKPAAMLTAKMQQLW